MRKPYTSMLFVLLFIALGTVMYFYYSSKEPAVVPAQAQVTGQQKPPAEQPKPTIGVVIKQKQSQWVNFVKNIMTLKPKLVVSDGEDRFLCVLAASSPGEAWMIRDSVKKFSKAPKIIDTMTVGSEFTFIIGGKLPPSKLRNPLSSVKKFEINLLMNFIDSLAQAKGLSKPTRNNIGVDRINEGERFRYVFSSSGSPLQISRFFNDVIQQKYAFAPISLKIELADSIYLLKVVWGIYTFSAQADSTEVSARQ